MKSLVLFVSMHRPTGFELGMIRREFFDAEHLKIDLAPYDPEWWKAAWDPDPCRTIIMDVDARLFRYERMWGRVW